MIRNLKPSAAICFNAGPLDRCEYFNGEFYYQKIQPVSSIADVAPHIYSGNGSTATPNPPFQIGGGLPR